MIKITKRQSDYLNRKIKEAEDAERHDLYLTELMGTGKVIPYIGWFWHDVDFTKPIWLGCCVEFVGFLESNKWGYPRWQLTDEQDSTLKALFLDLNLEQGKDAIERDLQEIYRYIQSCCPLDRDVEKEALAAASSSPAITNTERGIHVGYN